jgi:hypothetical protein
LLMSSLILRAGRSRDSVRRDGRTGTAISRRLRSSNQRSTPDLPTKRYSTDSHRFVPLLQNQIHHLSPVYYEIQLVHVKFSSYSYCWRCPWAPLLTFE